MKAGACMKPDLGVGSWVPLFVPVLIVQLEIHGNTVKSTGNYGIKVNTEGIRTLKTGKNH